RPSGGAAPAAPGGDRDRAGQESDEGGPDAGPDHQRREGGGDHRDAQHGRRELGGGDAVETRALQGELRSVRHGTDVEPLPRRPSTGGTGCDEQVDARRCEPGEDQRRHRPAASSRARRSMPRAAMRWAARTRTSPVQSSDPSTARPNTSVTVKWTASGSETRSSTATIPVRRGPSGPRSVCTTRSTESLTRLLRALSGRSREESDSWARNRSRVNPWRADPAWMVVYPVTPDDRVNSRGSASRSRTSPTMATSGAMRRKPATSRRRSIPGRSVRGGRV